VVTKCVHSAAMKITGAARRKVAAAADGISGTGV
jgi:hypothetical protein